MYFWQTAYHELKGSRFLRAKRNTLIEVSESATILFSTWNLRSQLKSRSFQQYMTKWLANIWERGRSKKFPKQRQRRGKQWSVLVRNSRSQGIQIPHYRYPPALTPLTEVEDSRHSSVEFLSVATFSSSILFHFLYWSTLFLSVV